jgi:surfeit locus 1 family protein
VPGTQPPPTERAPAARPDPDAQPGYGWAARPAWLLSHLFVLACVLVFVRLGFWQVSRLSERRAANALIEARQSGPPVPVETVVRAGSAPDEVETAIYRAVTVTGTWRPDEQVLVRNETYNGAPGSAVVTPLVLADGQAVAVNRGWIPVALAAGDPAAYAPPTGPVTITGVVARTEIHQGLGPTDPAEGRLHDLARVDVGRLARQVSEPLLPVYITLRSPAPEGGRPPLPVTPPVLDDGPHLNYAGQWFIFATLTCIVYPLLLRRTARQRADRVLAGGPADGDGGGDGLGGGIGPDDRPDGDGTGSAPAEPAEPAELTPGRR